MTNDERHYQEMMKIIDKGRRDTWIIFIIGIIVMLGMFAIAMMTVAFPT